MIDADAVCELFEPFTDAFTDVEVTSAYVQTLTLIHNTPSIDIVRCKECKFAEGDDKAEMYRCRSVSFPHWNKGEHFCSYGERESE